MARVYFVSASGPLPTSKESFIQASIATAPARWQEGKYSWDSDDILVNVNRRFLDGEVFLMLAERASGAWSLIEVANGQSPDGSSRLFNRELDWAVGHRWPNRMFLPWKLGTTHAVGEHWFLRDYGYLTLCLCLNAEGAAIVGLNPWNLMECRGVENVVVFIGFERESYPFNLYIGEDGVDFWARATRVWRQFYVDSLYPREKTFTLGWEEPGLRFGLEVEGQKSEKFLSLNLWDQGYDSSIEVTRDNWTSVEFRSPRPLSFMEAYEAIRELLVTNKGSWEPANTCGIHIHVSGGDLEGVNESLFHQWIVYWWNKKYRWIPQDAGRRRFAGPVREPDYVERRKEVNFCSIYKHGTVEFRAFDSTADLEQFMEYLWLASQCYEEALKSCPRQEQHMGKLGRAQVVKFDERIRRDQW